MTLLVLMMVRMDTSMMVRMDTSIMVRMDTSMIVKMGTCITLIGRPVSFARVSRMCLVGFGV